MATQPKHKHKQQRDRQAMAIVTDLLPVHTAAVVAAATEDENDGYLRHEDTLSELPHLPRRTRAVTQADVDEFATAAEAAESTERRTPRGVYSPRVQRAASTPPPVAVAAAVQAAPGTSSEDSVGPSDFELLCVIGQGAFGKVRGLLIKRLLLNVYIYICVCLY